MAFCSLTFVRLIFLLHAVDIFGPILFVLAMLALAVVYVVVVYWRLKSARKRISRQREETDSFATPQRENYNTSNGKKD
jgi:Ca2+/Na+ antiporter